MSVNGLNVTREGLLEQVNVWLATLSTMRLHGPQNYRKDGDFVRLAHDFLRMLDLPDAPREPSEHAGDWTIERQIQALENIRLFLQAAAESKEVADVEVAEGEIPAAYREGGKPDGELLTVTYCSRFETYGLSGSDFSRDERARETRIKHGREYIYRFDVVAAMSAAKHARK